MERVCLALVFVFVKLVYLEILNDIHDLILPTILLLLLQFTLLLSLILFFPLLVSFQIWFEVLFCGDFLMHIY